LLHERPADGPASPLDYSVKIGAGAAAGAAFVAFFFVDFLAFFGLALAVRFFGDFLAADFLPAAFFLVDFAAFFAAFFLAISCGSFRCSARFTQLVYPPGAPTVGERHTENVCSTRLPTSTQQQFFRLDVRSGVGFALSLA
jgi:hypothetical protein